MTNTYFGISTILFCRDLPNEEAENLIRGKGFKKTYNPRIDSCEYVNKHYADQGVQITVSKFNDSPWSLYVYVNPPLVLGNRGSYCSIVPNYTAFVAAINKILSEVNSPRKLCSMKINRSR